MAKNTKKNVEMENNEIMENAPVNEIIDNAPETEKPADVPESTAPAEIIAPETENNTTAPETENDVNEDGDDEKKKRESIFSNDKVIPFIAHLPENVESLENAHKKNICEAVKDSNKPVLDWLYSLENEYKTLAKRSYTRADAYVHFIGLNIGIIEGINARIDGILLDIDSKIPVDVSAMLQKHIDGLTGDIKEQLQNILNYSKKYGEYISISGCVLPQYEIKKNNQKALQEIINAGVNEIVVFDSLSKDSKLILRKAGYTFKGEYFNDEIDGFLYAK